MLFYKYDEKTHEFIGIEQACLDPLETEIQGKNIFIPVDNSTDIIPPNAKKGYVAVFSKDKWKYVEDHRGERYWLKDDIPGTPARVMEELGQMPFNFTKEKPQAEESNEEIQARLTATVQMYMDRKAQEKNFDNILSACSYENDTNPMFARHAKLCKEWRSQVWTKCYQLLDEVLDGRRKTPTEEELIRELPILDWGE